MGNATGIRGLLSERAFECSLIDDAQPQRVPDFGHEPAIDGAWLDRYAQNRHRRVPIERRA
jgi:hypothetical protein